MQDTTEHALVRKALTCGLSNCCEWKDLNTVARVRKNPVLDGLTPEGIKSLLLAHVRGGGRIEQVEEKRPAYRRAHRYYYKAVVPVPELPRGLFVELVLVDDDAPGHEFPEVAIVNAHRQSF